MDFLKVYLQPEGYRCAIAVILLSTCSFCFPVRSSADSIELGGGEYVLESQDPDWLQKEMIKIQEAVKAYNAERNIAPSVPPQKSTSSPIPHVMLQYPLRAAASFTDFGFDGISNFVDRNAITGSTLDSQCGNRTYDRHDGTDLFLWPFPWYKVDNNQVEGVAAADGIIVAKGDGNQDRSCAMNNGTTWNFVTLQHADGTYTVYGHLKKDSVTTKTVGTAVSAGEYLGIIASSGSSTGPHLHFSVHDQNWRTIDPFLGPCNTDITESWWLQQPTTQETKVNSLLIHNAPPVMPACPQTETINASGTFHVGELAYFAVYLRDENAAFAGRYTVYRPDGTVFKTWSHNKNSNYYASWWWWSWYLPVDAAPGTWRFEISFSGKTYSRSFQVIDKTLSIFKAGTGSGTVTSYPAGVSCGANCSAGYIGGSTLTLSATTTAGSTFTGWSNDCTGVAPCLLAMTTDKKVTANFGVGPRARVLSTGYATLNDAYSAAGGNGTILVTGGVITESLILNKEKKITVRGGYASDFNVPTNGTTILDGLLVIQSGSLTADGLAVK